MNTITSADYNKSDPDAIAPKEEENLNSRGTKTLLVGPPGLDLFVIGTDPGFEESLLDAMDRKKLPLEKLHYQYIAPASATWEALIENAQKVNMLNFEGLSGLKPAGSQKATYKQFIELLMALNDFTDKRTGESFGPVDAFPENSALAIDSLSGVNIMAMDLMIGGKPTAAQGEWGVAMNMEEKLILKLTSDLKCFFVLTAHIEKEPDMLTGVPITMVGALGKKLAPKIPRTFSDVILSVKEGSKFTWSTAALNVDLKTRSLPIKDGLDPSFVQIVEAWKRRNAMR
jgi:hypothetical protein